MAEADEGTTTPVSDTVAAEGAEKVASGVAKGV